MNDDFNVAFFREELSPKPRDPLTKNTLINAGIGEEYWRGAKLGSIPDQCAYKRELFRMVKTLHIDELGGKGAIFYGNFGYGKTAAGVIMLKAALVRGAQGYFYEAVNIEAAHEKTWVYQTPEGIHVWDMACRGHFFVLDDLGTELVRSGYKAGDTRVVESLIRARYNRRLPTYITTNLPLPQMMKSYPSLRSIFLDPKRFDLIKVTGKDWRAAEEN
jgi:DNA replication protein DnaC